MLRFKRGMKTKLRVGEGQDHPPTFNHCKSSPRLACFLLPSESQNVRAGINLQDLLGLRSEVICPLSHN